MKKRIHCLTAMLSILLLSILLLSGCGAAADPETNADTPDASEEELSETETPSSDTSGTKETLVVAMELAYPPFEMRDEAGDPAGIAPDMMKAFGEYAGYDIQIENTAWDGLIPSLQTGAADIVISSMTITEERKNLVDFSDPYANALLAVLAGADSGISSVEDLNQSGKVLAVKSGSTGHMYAEKNLPEAELLVLPDESACVTEVAQGRADGFIYDQLTIYRNWQNNLDTTTAIFIPFQDVEKWGIAVQKGNQELLDELNTFLSDFAENGGYEELTEKYLSEEKKAFDELGFQWFFDMKE